MPRSSEPPVGKLVLDWTAQPDPQSGDEEIHVSFAVPSGESRKFSFTCRNDFGLSDANLKLQWKAKAFFRRRLSELRDNHLSKNPLLLSAAKVLQRRLLKGGSS